MHIILMKKITLLSCLVLLLSCNSNPKEQKGTIAVESISLSAPETNVSFTPSMEGPLRVLSASPIGVLQAIESNFALAITFSVPMTPLGEQTPISPNQITLDPAAPGTLRWEGTQTLVFQPSTPLVGSTQYTATLAAGIQSLDGQTLEEPYTWTFEMPRPKLTSSFPQNNEQYAEPISSVRLNYNMDLDTTQLDGYFTLFETSSQRNVPFELLTPAPDTVILDPLQDLTKGTFYSIQVKPGVPPATGQLGTMDMVNYTFRVHPELRFESFYQGGDWTNQVSELNPSWGIGFNFSTRVRYSDFVNSISFSPALKMPSDAENNTWYISEHLNLNVQFQPETRYTFRIDSLYDVHGQLIPRAEGAFTTKPYSPSLNIPTGLVVVEAEEQPYLPLSVTNWENAKVGMERLTSEEVIPHLAAYDRYYRNILNLSQGQAQAIIPASQNLPLDIQRNVPAIKPFDLTPALDTTSTGIVGVHMVGPNVLRSMVQVTKMGISAKFSPYQNVYVVTDLKTASPVANATVSLRGPDNQVYWTGATDADGKAESPGWYAAGMKQQHMWSEPNQFVFAEKEGDIAFTSSRQRNGLEPYRFGLNFDYYADNYEDYDFLTGGYYRGPVVYQGLAYSDRGLYKAGETVLLKGMVRAKTDGEWTAYTDSVYVSITSPDGEEVYSNTLKPSVMGTFDIEWISNAGAALGRYDVSLSRSDADQSYISSGTFRIDAFRRATFAVDVNATSAHYVAGDFFEGTVAGHYLFGAAMQQQPVRYSLVQSATRYTPPGYDGYEFRSANYWEWHGGQTRIASGDSQLDMEGMYAVKEKIPGMNGQVAKVTFRATVTDPSRQESSSSTEAIVHPGLFYIGLKPNTRFVSLEESNSNSIDIITVDPAGQPVAVDAIKISLVKENWNSVREVGTDGRTRWRSERTEEEVLSETIHTEQGLARRVTLPLSEGGSYIFKAEATDVRGNTMRSGSRFYVTGSGYVAWQRNDDDRIELIAEKTTFSPGETARIMVQSPFEEATALITVEREGILSSRVTTLVGSAPQIEIPISEAHMPNVYVSVMLLQGRSAPPDGGSDPGAPTFKMGYIPLRVDPDTRHLAVEIIPDAETYRPGDEVTVDLRLVNKQGQGVPGEITFSAADAGVLNLINYVLPDPFDTFYGVRHLGVRTSQTLASLIKQRDYGQKERDEGGGGGMDGNNDVRRDFRPSAYWNPSIQTDERGRAQVTFTLPESITTFRFMASALTEGNLFGNGQKDVIVTQPLILKPALPRFARLGDTFEAGVLLTNTTGNSGDATIAASAEAITLNGLDSKAISIDDGATKEIRFDWTTTQPSDATFTFNAQMGREQDAFELSVPIVLPTIKTTQATFASTADQANEAFRLPGNIVPELGNLQAQISSTALVGLDGAADYLFTYPYGCLEQRTSRIRPLFLGDELLSMFDIEVLDGDKDKEIERWFSQLREYWQYRGFSLWPGRSGRINHYVTAYVILALAEARDAGYQIPQQITNDALNGLEEFVRNSNNKPDYFQQRTWNDTRALMLFALARHDRFLDQEIFTLTSSVLNNAPQISIDGQSHILRTLLLRSNQSSELAIQRLVQAIAQRLRVESTTAYLTATQDPSARWIFASDTRSTAFGLSALIQSDPPEEYRRFVDMMVRYLIQTRQAGHWASTQENAAVIEALSLFRQTYEVDEPQFTADITVAGQSILNETFSGRSLDVKENQVALTGFPLSETLPVNISKSGTGQLYYTVRLESYSLDPVESLSQGLSVSRTIERVNETGTVIGAVTPIAEGVRTLNAGEMVRVTLRLTSTADRNYVVVDDPLPAGLETINAAFATSDQSLTQGTGRTRWWGSFNHTEKHDDKVLLFADYLTRGEHTYTYIARATTPGTFVHPPVQTELMYQPEINGRTASGTLRVQASSPDLSVR